MKPVMVESAQVCLEERLVSRRPHLKPRYQIGPIGDLPGVGHQISCSLKFAIVGLIAGKLEGHFSLPPETKPENPLVIHLQLKKFIQPLHDGSLVGQSLNIPVQSQVERFPAF
jgi:hypothetical protein